MAQFASVSELADYLGMGVDIDNPRAVLLLELASAAIQEELHQDIEYVEDAVATLQGNWTRILDLPERPAISVSKVVLNDLEVAPAQYLLRPGSKLLWGAPVAWANGPDLPADWAHWGGPLSKVEVTYTHGFVPIPSGIKRVCLAAAGRAYREQLAGQSVDYAASPGTDLTDAERTALQRRFGRLVTSIQT